MKINAPILPVPPSETLSNKEIASSKDAAEFDAAFAAASSVKGVHQSVEHTMGTSAKNQALFAAALDQNHVALDKRQVLAGQHANAIKSAELFNLLSTSYAKEGLDNTARLLRRQVIEDTSFESFFEHAEKDPSLAKVLLEAAVSQARNENNPSPKELATLNGHLATLEKRHGNQARAGINTVRAFRHNDPKRRKEMRKLYYDSITVEQTVLAMITVLLTRCENDSRREGFSSELVELKAAIADDLAALRPSTSRAHLRLLMKGMSTAQHLTALLESTDNLLARMRKKNPRLNVDSPKFLKTIILLTGNGMNVRQTEEMALQMMGAVLKHQLAFLNQLLVLLKKIPKELWRDTKSHDNAITNLNLLLTKLTQAERQTFNQASAFRPSPTFHELPAIEGATVIGKTINSRPARIAQPVADTDPLTGAATA